MNFESDSVKLINAVNGEDEKDRSSFGNVVLGILSLRRCFDSVSFKHVNRKANGAAHELPIMLMLSPTVLGWKMPLLTLCICVTLIYPINLNLLVFKKKN